MKIDDLLLWFLICVTVALFASLQYDPCNTYADGSEAFMTCELGVK